MAKRTLLWTVTPNGRVASGGEHEGKLRVSAILSPRLTPETAAEQSLAAFPLFLDWPKELEQARFGLRIATATLKLHRLTMPRSDLWQTLFSDVTPVAGFEFRDMSDVNLRSFPVRNMLGYLRRHYTRLAVQAASNHPTLLPWKDAHPDLKGMLTDAGTRTRTITFSDRTVEVPLPGFSRFFGGAENQTEERLTSQVFGKGSVYTLNVPQIGAEEGQLPGTGSSSAQRALPPDWYNPRPSGPTGPLIAQPDAALMDQFSSQAEYAMYQANRFYRRETVPEQECGLRYPKFENVAPPPEVPAYDFHRILASYGSYPQLQRVLGVVLDFAVDDPDGLLVAGAAPTVGNMALAVKWADDRDDSDDGFPRTAYYLDEDRFVARPRGNDLVRGLLRLEYSNDGWGVVDKEHEGLFDIYQVDPDGAALKTVDFTLSTQNLVAKHLDFNQPDGLVTYTTGDRQPVAALRSGGLGVSQHGRAEKVALDAAAAAQKNQAVEAGNAPDIVFFAEDLMRGYRVDVAPVPKEDAAGPWHSLNARIGTYEVISTGQTFELGSDEGHVSGASTTQSESDTANRDDHYLHESLFRWTGWSLSAPRPGRTIRAGTVEGTQLQSETPAVVTDKAEKGNDLAVTYRVQKGTLPKLRFGQLYRMRARYVDVAGNSLHLDDPTLDPLEQASDAVGYWRFEPIDPPAIMGRARLSEGESLERLVIRSNYDATPQEYLSTPDFSTSIATPASQDFEYTARNERHVVPPKSSQQQCETHGLFDPYFGAWNDIKKGYEIAAREEGTLYDGGPGASVELITPTKLADIAQTKDVPPALPTPENPVGDRMAPGQYVIHREAQIVPPYLPDGAAAGVALRGLPGADIPGVTAPGVIGPSCAVVKAPNGELVMLITHAKDWPDSLGFRIVLAERPAEVTDLPCDEVFADDGAPQWDDDKRVLTLFLPKGRIARLRYSSFAHLDHVDTFGIIDWARDSQDPAFVRDMGLLGCHWMLTPFRTLTLVHATQQPVCLPEMIKLSIQREVGAQSARIICRQIRLHGPSTGKFEIRAEWHEWTDDLNRPAPERVARKGQLSEIQLAENHPNTFHLASVVAAQNVDPQRPRARGDVQEFGDTRFRLVSYRLQATTRFREYLPPALYAKPELVTRLGPVPEGDAVAIGADDDPGAPVLRELSAERTHKIVLASEAPNDPRVLYVVPTFRWRRQDTAKGADITRLGNGLRVWLDRPWFSSGDGELLGVVLHAESGPFTDIPDKMQTHVTQWGLDPLWETTLPKSRTRSSDFDARVHSEQVRLQEFPDDPSVMIVGHRVHWDSGRGLWYCDIELDAGATYMPFVRLALVRFQPNALPGQKVSNVVSAEFAQVLPRRRAVFSRDGVTVAVRVHGAAPVGGPMKFNVESPLVGMSPADGPFDTGRNRFELVLQTRDPEIDSDMAWQDETTLDSAVVSGATGGFTVTPGLNPDGIFGRTAVAARPSRTIATRASGAVTLSAEMARAIGGLGTVTDLLDPPIWSPEASIPDTGRQPARLMLREFERYYTDHTVGERGGIRVGQRRIVEERLVYATIFDLPQ
ncbi:hypothetical protein KX928_19375 [Roseobacter sp. YSTF-M11]|uniref:Uncharacterized protein n=1 Tax=Roseobacter insulae TaxID=2859783 RepID=A0A9X1K061_9RHOB|nr:hypothetical protein [Roseobacter insulae]MBW4709950.1 hypothetical protein [Roseobacter insulae]